MCYCSSITCHTQFMGLARTQIRSLLENKTLDGATRQNKRPSEACVLLWRQKRVTSRDEREADESLRLRDSEGEKRRKSVKVHRSWRT